MKRVNDDTVSFTERNKLGGRNLTAKFNLNSLRIFASRYRVMLLRQMLCQLTQGVSPKGSSPALNDSKKRVKRPGMDLKCLYTSRLPPPSYIHDTKRCIATIMS